MLYQVVNAATLVEPLPTRNVAKPFKASPCPECQGTKLWMTKIPSGGGHGPRMLPGLGSWFMFAEFRLVLCEECGLTRFFCRQTSSQEPGQVRLLASPVLSKQLLALHGRSAYDAGNPLSTRTAILKGDMP